MAERMAGHALVVGGGIAGLSAAWGLRRRGWQVTLFEQGALPNPRASSHDEHRITRHAYGRMTGYARLMPQAFAAWDRLWADLGETHYLATGATYVLRHDDGWHDATAQSLGELGIGFRDLPLDQLATRFPYLAPQGIQRLVETDGAGMLFPVRILTAMVAMLARRGVAMRAYSQVSEVDPEGGWLVADGKRYAGDAVVVAAGAWADRLVPGLKGVAVPSRQAVLYLAPPAELAEAWSRAPVLLDRSAEGGLYILPPRWGTRLKIGDHHFSRRGDADADRMATEQDLERLWPELKKTFRDADRYAVLEKKACYYTVTEDERFLLRPLGKAGWAVSACSGHGFKLGALIGDGVAATIAGERPHDALASWAAGDS
ncbi:FAD-binding oxidoreductase [Roseomonas sp. 18066]|uniref:NAD(P)/FAD-dependent oxidoreductase n=1 Tax=Roseomonas sp. 18066 TaxID=2681412 RepID=UPI001F3FAFD8|nr:FAD-dependent oxidoreductase [Roseomonas sp. 18066]